MLKPFIAGREDRPGAEWLARFRAGREEAERWYRGDGLQTPPSAKECRAALVRHMPELIPHYDHVCALVGDDDMAHRMLSHYRPAPAMSACSQAVWLGKDGPALVRNYDYALDVVSDRFELTNWSGRRVISKAQRPWGGCIDGMNDAGLVASLTYGGGRAQGLGFSIILMLRYVLETCGTVAEGVAALSRIPVALAQNVTLLDRTGAYATMFLGPSREPAVTTLRACTNHQETSLQQDSMVRQDKLFELLDTPSMTLAALAPHFLQAPLYSRRADSPTVYTAVYWPAEGRVDYLWPGKIWQQGFSRFTSQEYTHDYGSLMAPH